MTPINQPAQQSQQSDRISPRSSPPPTSPESEDANGCRPFWGGAETTVGSWEVGSSSLRSWCLCLGRARSRWNNLLGSVNHRSRPRQSWSWVGHLTRLYQTRWTCLLLLRSLLWSRNCTLCYLISTASWTGLLTQWQIAMGNGFQALGRLPIW